MTKSELLSTYTAEQLAEMEKLYRDITQCREHNGEHLHSEEYLKILNSNRMVSELQSEVEKYRKSFEDAKKERDCQIAEYRNRTEKDKTEFERAKNTINQIDDILEKLFGVRHDMVDKPDEFEKILSEKVKGNVADFLPTEPIKVVDMLINTERKYECDTFERAFYGTNKSTYCIFDIGELRQIAEHLLVYCNYNGESENG